MLSLKKIRSNRIKAFCTILVCALLLVSCADYDRAPPPTILIESVTIVDPITGPNPNQWVLVENGVIQSVQGKRPLVTYSDLIVVDGRGKYLIPGLWDSHVHLTFRADFSAEEQLKHFLRFGITSVRDTGGQISQLLKVRDYAARQPLASAQVYVSGPLLDGKPLIYDGGPGFPGIGVEIDSPAQAREVVDDLWQRGVDFIKIYELVSPEVFNALLTQAHERGLPVAAHVPLSLEASQIAASKIGSLEHLRNLEYGCSAESQTLLKLRQEALKNENGLRGGSLRHSIHSNQQVKAMGSANQTRCARMIEQFAKTGIAQVPTLGLVGVFDTSYWLDEFWLSNVQTLPEGPKRRYQARAKQMGQSKVRSNKPALYQWSKDLLSQLHKASVPIIAGSDAPILLQVPGISLHDELWLLTQSGLSPMAALQSATIEAARFFGLEDEIGTIGAGKKANLILLNADPLKDIRNTRSIAAVINRGFYLDEYALKALVEP